MKVVIVNCFDTYEERVELVHEFFKEKGNDVTIIQSNFKHFKKEYRTDSKKNHIFVNSKSYYKNISTARLSSHYNFAEDAFKIVEEIKPDFLYTFVPPNSLAKFAANYKQKHNDVKLVLDILDLWPETMPIGKMKSLFPFTLWNLMRDKSLKYADLVLTECDLYQSVLSNNLKDVNVKTLYLAKKDINIVSNPQLSKDEIHLAYLGSINNIIDIPKIKKIIEIIRIIKPVTLHIIGDGESKEELINSAIIGGATVKYYGKIYSNQEKQDIFDICHFGLNIMKKSVCVGLTMKSIDYFQHGLPIINNIPADTKDLVDKYGVGINITPDFDVLITDLVKVNNNLILDMRAKSSALFKKFFSVVSFKENMDKYLRS